MFAALARKLPPCAACAACAAAHRCGRGTTRQPGRRKGRRGRRGISARPTPPPREALSRSLKQIVDNIKATLEITPPELVADIHERGILMTGGGALLRGIDQLVTRATSIPVRIADDPLTAMVRGAAILLDDEELLREVAAQTGYKTNN